MKRISSTALAAGLLASAFTGWSAPGDAGYRLEKKIVLGGDGGWDYFAVDADTGRVFIPRGTHLMVLSAEGGRIAEVTGIRGAHAIAFAPGLNRAFLSTGNSVTVIDTSALKVLKEIRLPGDRDPDAILYDSASKRVFTFNGGGTEDATAIDAVTGMVAGNVALGGKPEFAQSDGSGTIYVNIEDKSKLLAFDSRTLKVLHAWPLQPCESPSGLAIDRAHHRLFAGCHNGMMAVVDYGTGKVAGTVPIGKGVDANRFDPGTGLAFASCGDGTITVASETAPGKYGVAQTIRTERGARTMALDTKSHKIYTVTAQFGPPPPATKDHPHPWPAIISKTFTLLIFSR